MLYERKALHINQKIGGKFGRTCMRKKYSLQSPNSLFHLSLMAFMKDAII